MGNSKLSLFIELQKWFRLPIGAKLPMTKKTTHSSLSRNIEALCSSKRILNDQLTLNATHYAKVCP
jgi:hypothetical protein